MNAIAKILPPSRCLVLLLCVAGCDHVWSRLAGPNGLGTAIPTKQNEVDDGTQDPIAHDDLEPGVDDGVGSPDGTQGGTRLCCGCTGSCTQPDNYPDPR
jgi:hypothetical protein